MLGISKDDVEFLKKLQNTMNTQDHVCQAEPRYWVIQATVKEFGIDSEYADGSILSSCDGDNLADDMKEAFDYLQGDATESMSEDIIKSMSYDEASDTISYVDEENEEQVLCDFDDVLTFLNDDTISISNYRNVEQIYANTMFITNDACKAHIKANHYHYAADAHSYAMTAWRSPEIERLWKIIETLNWSELETSVDK